MISGFFLIIQIVFSLVVAPPRIVPYYTQRDQKKNQHTINDVLNSDSNWNQYNQQSVNVKNFGAKGDGISDDTEAINNAIKGNRNVFFPDGIYIINQPLYVIEGSNLRGGSNTTIKAGNHMLDPSKAINVNLLNVYMVSNVTVSKITFDFTIVGKNGIVEPKTRSGACLRIYNITSDTPQSLRNERTFDFKIEGCTFKGGSTGVAVNDLVENVTVTNCIFDEYMFSGISFNQTYSHDILDINATGQKGSKTLSVNNTNGIKKNDFIAFEGLTNASGEALWKQIKQVTERKVELYGSISQDIDTLKVYKILKYQFPQNLTVKRSKFKSDKSKFAAIWLSGGKSVLVDSCEILDRATGIVAYVNDFGNRIEDITISNNLIKITALRPGQINGAIILQGISYLDANKSQNYVARNATIYHNRIMSVNDFSRDSVSQRPAILVRSFNDVNVSANWIENFSRPLYVTNTFKYKSGIYKKPYSGIKIQSNHIANFLKSPYSISGTDSINIIDNTLMKEKATFKPL